MTGWFIAFEGGDGTGKSTQVEILTEAFEAAGCTVTATREAGGTPVGAALRALLVAEEMPPKAEALLFIADRAIHAADVIRPALERGEIVVSDRYSDSTTVYQGAGRGLGMTYLHNLSAWATDGLEPDLVIVLDIDPRIGLDRVQRYRGQDRFEREVLAFHDRVRAEFLERAALGENHRQHLNAKTRYVVVNANQTVDDVASDVLDAATELFGRVACGMYRWDEEITR